MSHPGAAVRDAPAGRGSSGSEAEADGPFRRPSESWPSDEEPAVPGEPRSRLAAALNAKGAEPRRRARRRHAEEPTPPGAMAYGFDHSEPAPRRRREAEASRPERRASPAAPTPARIDPARSEKEPARSERQAEVQPRRAPAPRAEAQPRRAPAPRDEAPTRAEPRPVAAAREVPPARQAESQDIEVRVQPRRPRPAPQPAASAAAEPTLVGPVEDIEVQVVPRRRAGAEPVEARPPRAAPVPPEQAGPPSGMVKVRVTALPPGGAPQPSRRIGRRERKPKAIVVVLGGLVWFGLLVASFDISPVLLGIVMTPVGVIAVLSAWRTVTHLADVSTASDPERTPFGMPSPVALAGLVMLGITPVVSGVGGPVVMIVWLIVSAGALVQPYLHQPGGVLRRATLASVLPALGAGCLVLADRQGAEIGMVLIAGYCLFDVANASMGTGRTGGVVGAVSGFITLLVLAIIVQSLLAPPFTGRTPWVFCVMVGLLAPLGVWFCSRIAPGRLPALRRLDSLVFAAPVWVLGICFILHR